MGNLQKNFYKYSKFLTLLLASLLSSLTLFASIGSQSEQRINPAFSRSPNVTSGNSIISGLRGYIPLYFRGDIATDLEYKGQLRSADELYSLWKKGELKDLSLLNPITQNNLNGKTVQLADWKNIFPSDSLQNKNKNFQSSGAYKYSSYMGKSMDQFMMVVSDSSSGEMLNLGIGPRAINNMMRQALLYKIGYNVLGMEVKSSVTVRFKNYLEKRRFFINLNSRLNCSASEDSSCDAIKAKNLKDRSSIGGFILEGELSEEQKDGVRAALDRYINFFDDTLFDLTGDLVVKNVVVMEPVTSKRNLALTISPGSIKGKRKYAALVVPYALVDLPESINLFSYSIGSVIDRKLELDFFNAKKFSTNYEDARWVARRIAKLGESDFLEIAQSTNFPYCTSLQLSEILKSRRNSMIRHLGLAGEFKEWDVNYSLNCDDIIVDGILTKKRFEGFGNQFSHDRYQGPLVGSEIWALVKSIGFSNVIFNLMDRLNDKMPGTDVASKIYEHNLDVAARQFAHYVKHKEILEMPFQSYPISYTSFDLIYSRNIVAGPYLGTNNAVQLVENIGMNLGVGKYFGWDGLKPRDFLSANLGLNYRFTVSHIQPIHIKMPKKEGDTSGARGAFEEAVKKQVTGLFNIFSFPFDAFEDYNDYEARDVDIEEILPSPVRAVILSLDSQPVLQADIRKVFHSLNSSSGKKGLKEAQEAMKPLMRSYSKHWRTLKDSFAEELKKLNKDANPKKYSPGKLFGEVMKSLANAMDESERIKNFHFDQVVDSFLNEFKVGDSLIAHHDFNINAGINSGHALTSKAAWFLDLSSGKKKLFRTHITRLNKKDFQIYRSIADKTVMGFVAGLRIYFRFMYYGYDYSFGDVNSRLYTIQIAEKSKKTDSTSVFNKKSKEKSYRYDDQIVGKMNALKSLLYTGRIDEVKKYDRPVRVDHKFSEHRHKFGLLWWRGDYIDNFHRMDIVDREGEETLLVKYTKGARVGAAYQDYLIDYANVYLKEHSSKDIKLNIAGNSDPGKSFFGYSKYREGSMEAIIPREDAPLDQQCLSINYRWNQFVADPDDLKKELEGYKRKFGLDLTRMEALKRTERIDIFSFNTTYNLYADALAHISNLSMEEVSAIVSEHMLLAKRDAYKVRCESTEYFNSVRYEERVAECHPKSILRSFKVRFKSLKENLSMASYKDYMRSMTKFVLHSEKFLDPVGFHKIVGGSENLFLISSLSGYRKGDENSSKNGVLTFDSFGRAPGPMNLCPVQAMASLLNYNQSELLLYWLNSRL